MKITSLILPVMLAFAALDARAQQGGEDSTRHEKPVTDSRSSMSTEAIPQSDTLAIDSNPEADTTSTRTFGTAPGTGTTGAGSGNGDAAGNTGTPGSDTMGDDASSRDRSRKQDTP